MPTSYRVVQYGVGPIGQSCLRTLLSKHQSIELVGAIDIDPDKVGKDVGEITGLGIKTDVIISADAEAVLRETKPDVVVHTTSSFLSRMSDQLVQCGRERGLFDRRIVVPVPQASRDIGGSGRGRETKWRYRSRNGRESGICYGCTCDHGYRSMPSSVVD